MNDLLLAIKGLLTKPDVCPESRRLIEAALRTQAGSTSLEREVKVMTAEAASDAPQRAFAQQLFAMGKGCKSIARLMGLPQGTIKTWRFRGKWKRVEPPSTQENEPPLSLIWCYSASHDALHLVDPATLKSWCGATVGNWGAWAIQAAPDHSKKCTRCMNREKNAP